MRILTYVPLNPTQPRLHPLTAASIESLDWPTMPIVYGRNDTPNKMGKFYDLCDKHNQARAMVLQGGYDALFLVEADMVLPPDALRRLVALDVPVAYGLYVSRGAPHEWLALTSLTPTEHEFVSTDHDYVHRWFGDGTQAIETQGVGMGCTLIKREVLAKLAFHLDRFGANADDWAFSLDCIAYGILQVTHTGVICGHIDGETVLWPDVTKRELVRKEKL